MVTPSRYTPHFFAIFMSVNPVFGAVIGAVVLAEALGPLDWTAIALIVAANVGCVLAARARVVAPNVPFRSENLENVAQ